MSLLTALEAARRRELEPRKPEACRCTCCNDEIRVNLDLVFVLGPHKVPYCGKARCISVGLGFPSGPPVDLAT